MDKQHNNETTFSEELLYLLKPVGSWNLRGEVDPIYFCVLSQTFPLKSRVCETGTPGTAEFWVSQNHSVPKKDTMQRLTLLVCDVSEAAVLDISDQT